MKVDSISALELTNLVHLPIGIDFNEFYSGSYSYLVDSLGNIVLDGHFVFSHRDSSIQEVGNKPISYIEVMYAGEFKNGKKNGIFHHTLIIRDNDTIHSQYVAQIQFDMDNCIKGSFTGKFNHGRTEKNYEFKNFKFESELPIENYEFQNLDTCTFDHIIQLAKNELI